VLAINGSVLTIGSDRRISSDAADFDAKADTALFTGNVLINQQRNVLQGQRLFVDRKASKSRLDAPSEGGQPAGRIAATFYQSDARTTAQKGKTAATHAAAEAGEVLGSFKADPNAPIDIEADTLDVYDTARQAVFRGNVKSQQGDFVVRTVTMTAFYSGQTGLGLAGGDDPTRAPAQLIRVEAREQVLVKSKDGQTATGEWANFDVKANSVLMGDHVIVSRGKDVAQGPRLKIDLTSGMYRFELESEAASPATSASPPQTQPPQATDPNGRACPPGKQCLLFYPKDAQDNAKNRENARENARDGVTHSPGASPPSRSGWEPSNSASPVLRSD
jgi:lipopolysaccharide transport protein LptA